MSDIQIINPLTYSDWDNLVLSIPGHSIFHSSAWAKVLHDSYGYKPVYFAYFDRGVPTALFPLMEVDSNITGKRGVSLPFSDYCDPLVTNHEHFFKLYRTIVDHGKKTGWRYIEIRGDNAFNKMGRNSRSFLTHRMDLSANVDILFSKLRSSTGRNIKKAIKEGVEVRLERTLESLEDFIELNIQTRKRHGLPPQPKRFFQYIFKHIVCKGLGFLSVAFYYGKRIASACFFHFGDTGYLKYNASDIQYHHLRPNNITIWEALRWFSQNGYRQFDFGRTDLDNHGLIQFKRGWHPVEKKLHYHKYDLKKQKFVRDDFRFEKISNCLFRNLPTPFLKIVGSICYKHAG